MKYKMASSGIFSREDIRDLFLVLFVLILILLATGWYFQYRMDLIDHQIEILRSNDNKYPT